MVYKIKSEMVDAFSVRVQELCGCVAMKKSKRDSNIIGINIDRNFLSNTISVTTRIFDVLLLEKCSKEERERGMHQISKLSSP